MVHRGAFSFQTQSAGTRRPSVATAAAACSFADLQLLSSSGGSPASRSHHKGDSGGGSGSFVVEGEEWGIGRVPSDVSRWAGVGVVQKLEVRAGGPFSGREGVGGGRGGGGSSREMGGVLCLLIWSLVFLRSSSSCCCA